MRRLLGVVLIVAATAVAAWLLMRHRGAAPVAQGQATGAWQTVLFWPGEKQWAWTVPGPPEGAKGSWIELRIRESSSARREGYSPVVGLTEPVAAKEAEREFGTGGIGAYEDGARRPIEVTAAIQLIDLAEIGAASSRPGQTLRVLGKLAIGGGVTPLAGEDIFLPAGRFFGNAVRRGGEEWKDGQVYLMSFYVEGESRVYRYDVVLVHTAERKGPDGGTQ